jgi:hypothetical protein
MKELSLVLMTCGEKSEEDCVAAIEPFRDEVEFIEIRNVFPQIKALNKMIDSVQTEYFIPLDADMVLDHDAWPRIKNAINKNAHDNNWHSILFQLYDTLTEKNILALKILRTKIMKELPFVDSPTPDVEHYKRLTDAGYTCIDEYLKQRPIGKHVIKGKKFCYYKFKDVYQTYRAHNFEWDSGVFMGGNDLRTHAKSHYDFFLYKWIMTGDKDYLHCLAGMMDGILFPLENKSKSLEKADYRIESQWAFEAFMAWYMPELYKKGSGMMLF